jgi:hypothetical protein
MKEEKNGKKKEQRGKEGEMEQRPTKTSQTMEKSFVSTNE